jgi:hypothetical protein
MGFEENQSRHAWNPSICPILSQDCMASPAIRGFDCDRNLFSQGGLDLRDPARGKPQEEESYRRSNIGPEPDGVNLMPQTSRA